MKLARVLPAVAPVAALAIMMLDGAPAIAANRVEVVEPALGSGEFHPRKRAAEAAPNINRDTAPGRTIHTFSYNMTPAAASSEESRDSLASKQNGTGQVQAGIQWSPRVTNWSGYDARFPGLDHKRFNIAESGLVTVVDRHLVRSRVALSRRRIQLVIAADF
jgi:hypothetical protein